MSPWCSDMECLEKEMEGAELKLHLDKKEGSLVQ